MTLSVQSLQLPMGVASYYDEAWHLLLETHLPNFQIDGSTTVVAIDPIDGYRFEGDFYTLLSQKAYYVDPQHRWLVMRLNGLRSPSEFRGSMSQLVLPSFQKVDALFNGYLTIARKIT